MASKTTPIPEGMHSLTPHLVVSDASRFIEFCRSAFGGEESKVMRGPDGKGIMNATLRIGDSCMFVTDVTGWATAPATASLFLYVPDVDAVFAKAVKAGAKVTVPTADMFWGDRWGMVQDPFGNTWQIATHLEDLSPEEVLKRMKAQPPKPPPQ